MKNLRIPIGHGLNVAFQRWGAGNTKKVLCLHGWLDNSNSFAFLGPYLAEKCQVECVAIDFVGHGQSDHFHEFNTFSIFATHTKAVLDALGWEKPHIVGHSMGANASVLFAGSFPERVDKLILIEGLGLDLNILYNIICLNLFRLLGFYNDRTSTHI